MIKYHIDISDGAKSEIRIASAWYNEQKIGLGKEFFFEIEQVFERVEKNPYQFPIIVKNIRRAVCRRFPYSIFFTITNNRVLILAVFHTKQNPGNLPF